MCEIRRKVIGKGVFIEERVKNERRTKNIFTQKIVRKIVNCIILDCGHKISVLYFTNYMKNKVPSNNTRCRECEDGSNQATYCENPYLKIYKGIDHLKEMLSISDVSEILVTSENGLLKDRHNE